MDLDQDDALLLAPLRDLELTLTTTVNVHRAIHAGVRRKRARRAVGAGVIAGVAVLIATMIPTVLNGQTLNEPARPVLEFDIMTQEFTASIGRYVPVSYETGRFHQRVYLGIAGEHGVQEIAIATMYASGKAPMRNGERASDVHGRQAIWSGTGLAWEWADDAWGFVSIFGTDRGDRTRAHQIAESVALGPGVAVTVPFTVPHGVNRLVGVATSLNPPIDPSPGALLIFGDGISVGVQRDLNRELMTGMPAQPPPIAIPLSDGYFAIARSPYGDEDLAYKRQRAESVRLVDNPTDRRSWTNQPIR